MPKDHRIIAGGVRLSFSCENRGYKTDIGAGQAHGTHSNTRGSVTGQLNGSDI